MKRFLLIGLFLLTSCEKNEFTVPVPVGGGGGSYSAPRRPVQTPMAPPATTNHHPIIDNPDAEKEYISEEVYAADEWEAQQKCENLARSRTDRTAIVRMKGVRCLTKQPYKNGNYKFECQLEIEYQ
jgi:hypothetical protein